MGKLHPRVERLNSHILDEQHVLFSADPEETRQVLKDSEMTQLTAFFMLCEKEYRMYTSQGNGIPPYKDGGPPVREVLYRDVTKWYKWVRKNKDTGKQKQCRVGETGGFTRSVRRELHWISPSRVFCGTENLI